MNKTEAAQALGGVSTRAVERYVASGRLTATYVRGATGRVLDLDAGEVERLAAELNAPMAPAQATTATDKPDTTRPDAAQTAIVKVPREVPAVARVGGAEQILSALAALLDERQGAVRQATTARPSVPVEARLTLTLDQAAALSGVPKSILRAAIADGSLAAKKLGRSLKIRREILEAWVREAC